MKERERVLHVYIAVGIDTRGGGGVGYLWLALGKKYKFGIHAKAKYMNIYKVFKKRCIAYFQ